MMRLYTISNSAEVLNVASHALKGCGRRT